MDARRRHTIERLAAAGCVFAAAEADELLALEPSDEELDELVRRRSDGEPLPWLVGSVEFDGARLRIERGVYVPRPHTELLAARAGDLLPMSGRSVDLCTGCGALAASIARRRPHAMFIGTDIDPAAVACARANDVDARVGSLFDPVPAEWHASVDVIVGVLPYVPSPELAYLARDVQAHEPRLALDGGGDGLELVRSAIAEAPAWLRPSGALVLEVGGAQVASLEPDLRAAGFGSPEMIVDEDGDTRGFAAVLVHRQR